MNASNNSPKRFSLDGHVALVTGATTGLGKSIAMTLGKAGAKVAINYFNNQERAEAVFAEFKAAGCDGCLVKANVIEQSDVKQLVQTVKEELGPIDILVPNATCDQPMKPIEEYDWETYQAMLDFFIKSPFLLTQAVVADMKAQKWGRIINLGSEVYQRSLGNFSAYIAAKGGQMGWTRSMATELAPHGITVNIVTPGWIPGVRHVNDPQEMKDEYRSLIPAGRWGMPQDVAEAVLFFASKEAEFTNGQTLCVNGGMTPW
ncbi:MAG: SDR family oxidoreductase [Lentisphaeraceae bacterium]|nr:SDR family oxidoreductase [Lentisphaeraceae bacterium]